MKIAIVTVFNSHNFGSFWQAKSLCDVLTSKGYEVVFYDTKARSTWSGITYPALKRCVKALCRFDWKRVGFLFKEMRIFFHNLKKIRIIKSEHELQKCDAVIFGSDEIWNVSRPEMAKHKKLFGYGIPVKKKISYAVSVNNSTMEDLQQFEIDKYLSDFSAVSVRDEYSRQMLQMFTDKPVDLVLDPTLLLYKENFQAKYNEKCEDGYIAVYMFNVTGNQIKVIKEVAKAMNKKLLSVGLWLDWCDECVISDNPFCYYKNADYVITNTFHGTAFAINMEVNFCSFIKSQVKIAELLNTFDLKDRGIDEPNVNQLLTVLKTKIDWEKIKKRRSEQIENSMNYLEDNLRSNINEDSL